MLNTTAQWWRKTKNTNFISLDGNEIGILVEVNPGDLNTESIVEV